MKKKVAVIVPNLSGSGGDRIAMSQAKMFHSNGNDVVLFLLEDVQLLIHNFEFPVVSLTKQKNKFKLFGRLGYKLYAKILKSKMEEFGDFDLVISNLPRADRVVKELNHNNKYFVIHTSYKVELEKFSTIRASKKLKLYRYLYDDENIITITNAMNKDFTYLNITPKSIKTIYNPFNFENIQSKGNELIEYNFDYIICASVFRPEKRYDVLLDAFMDIKNQHIKLLLLVNSNQELMKMITERGLSNRVIIAGYQGNPYKYINNAKLLLLTSDREGLPTVVIESLILNTPVISTDCPTGPQEILVDELSKWLVPMNNSKELATKIDELLSSSITINPTLLDKFKQKFVYQDFKKLLRNE